MKIYDLRTIIKTLKERASIDGHMEHSSLAEKQFLGALKLIENYGAKVYVKYLQQINYTDVVFTGYIVLQNEKIEATMRVVVFNKESNRILETEKIADRIMSEIEFFGKYDI